MFIMRRSILSSNTCHVSERIPLFLHDSVRENVCRDLPADIEVSSKHYCLLHAPTKDKSAQDFLKIFRARIEAEQNDFRGVWFPDLTGLNGYIFKTKADFSFCIFTGKLYFWLVKFTQDVNFWGTIFESEVDFSESRFYKHADFRFVRFYSSADFSLTQFHAKSDFFGSFFNSNVLFTGAAFAKSSHAHFEHLTFNSGADFQFALINGSLTFKGSRGHQIFSKRSNLSFAHAEIKPRARVYFDNVLLKRKWLENADEKRLVFKTVRWASEKKRKVPVAKLARAKAA